jgi:hypothetical protein
MSPERRRNKCNRNSSSRQICEAKAADSLKGKQSFQGKLTGSNRKSGRTQVPGREAEGLLPEGRELSEKPEKVLETGMIKFLEKLRKCLMVTTQV